MLIGLFYFTTDGHTLKISQRIQTILQSLGHTVVLVSLRERCDVHLETFDIIVVGASIRYGKHHPSVVDFIYRHRAVLNLKPSAFFTVNLVARKSNKNTPETNPYYNTFLRKTQWTPHKKAVFAGKLSYPSYGLLDRWIIRCIMFLTKGPTDLSTVVEYTDWQSVESFAKEIETLAVSTL